MDLSNSNNRPKWGNHREYYLCVLGFAVGYPCFWRFPYLVYSNGGGLFLLPYIICVVILAVPTFYLETAIGQMFQDSVAKTFHKIKRGFRGLGVASVTICFYEAMYYNLFLAYSLVFLWDSFKDPLPWRLSHPKNGKTWNEKYFYDKVLQKSPSINDFGGINLRVLIAAVISFAIVFLCIVKGIKTSGKVAYLTVSLPYILLLIFLIRGSMLAGAGEGLAYLFDVDWSKFFTLDIWVKAAGQALFQCSTGQAVLILYAGFKDKNESIKKPTYWITAITTVSGILCAITAFVYLGHMSQISRVPINNLPLTGPDLIFIAFPSVITVLPYANVWAVLFFVMMFFWGVDTQFAFVETIASHFEEEDLKFEGRTLRPEALRFFVITIIFFSAFFFYMRGGFYLVQAFDTFTVIIPIMVVVLMECHMISKNYGWKKFSKRIFNETGEKVPFYVKYMTTKVVVPVLVILVLFAFYDLMLKVWDYPWWFLCIGFTLLGIPLQQIYVNYHEDMLEMNILMKSEEEKKMLELKELMLK